MKYIPLAQVANQQLSVVLNKQNCAISLYWRQAYLYLDLRVSDPLELDEAKRILICQGALCQNLADIVQTRSPYFSGALHFFDLEGDAPPHWQGLHTESAGRWLLLYAEEGEELPRRLH